MEDLSNAPISDIAKLPAELVPRERRDELAEYRAMLRRPPVKSEEEVELQRRTEEALKDQRGLKANLPEDHPPTPKKGPRGGRYTEARTKDGRPYRRYF